MIFQFRLNEMAHFRLREDFILLVEKGHLNEAELDFQRLVQQLGTLSDKALLDDYLRTQMLLSTNNLDTRSLIYKYQCAALLYLQKRDNRRLAAALARANKE